MMTAISPPPIERIRGVRVETGAHRPFLMDNPARVYLVERGHLDIFAIELSADDVAGRRRFVARVPAGEMAFGHHRVAAAQQPSRVFAFLAVPSLDAVLIEGERDGVSCGGFDLAAVLWIDSWIARTSEFLVRGRPPPRRVMLLDADPDIPYASGSTLSAQHGDVVWVSATAPIRLLGRSDRVVAVGEPLLPVTEQTWFEISADADVSAMYTPAALLTERLWPAFLCFGTRVLEFAVLAETEAAVVLETRRRQAHEARRASVAVALHSLGAVLGGSREAPRAAIGQAPLQAAAGLVAEAYGASLQTPQSHEEARAPVGLSEATERLDALARQSGIRTRQITLTPGWWRRDGPSFVGFTADGEKPLAILARPRGGYRAVDPESGAAFTIRRRRASAMASEGVVFYAPLADDIDSTKDILRFAFHRHGRDLRTLLAAGLLGGLTALLVPILTGQILAEILPRADVAGWKAALGALLLTAFGAAVFGIVQGLAMLRLEGRVDERLQAAIWSRVLALSAPFFRYFTAGDLADRVNGISRMRTLLTESAAQAAVSSVFSVFSFALLFYYSQWLALYVGAMLFGMVAITCLCAYGQVRHYREACHVQGAINGFIFQMISGISKLRVANAESYALARWAQQFSAQQRASLAARRWAAGQHAATQMFRPLTLVVILAFVHQAMQPDGPLTTLGLGAFISFNAAFGQLTAAVARLTTAATSAMAIIPLAERLQPVLKARPETAGDGIVPSDLTGDIEFANVSFRYAPEVPNAIDGVSFRINQGEYVAFVGPSGSGKSTLYRLLLGFERPDSGTVFLDGYDLAGLDPVAVRNHMGVVLQNGQLVSGSIYENIAGMSALSVDDAWAAARAAALDDDIRAMPMGMRTVVTDGGGGLSVGQKQRLMIARALAHKPRILLFDEATSALDNRSQATVQASLKRLSVTRVVIAHRLSSIRDVDRIFVMDAGRIVESGRYDDLIRRDGVFAALARRQLVQQ